MKLKIAALVLALGIGAALFPVSAQQGGGAFIPGFNYTIPGNWTFTGTNTYSGTQTITGAVTVTSLTTASGGQIGVGTGGAFALAQNVLFRTAPTVTSAGTSPSVTGSNGTAAFRVNVGTGGTATTIVMAMPAAATAWNCNAQNLTAAAANVANATVKQQSSSATAVTVQNQTVSTGAALAFTASDIVSFTCMAY